MEAEKGLVKILKDKWTRDCSFYFRFMREFLAVWLLPPTVEKRIDKTIINYNLGSMSYKILYKKPKFRRLMIKEIVSDGSDVTDAVTPYMGPNGDFHNQRLSPNDMGFTQLVFNLLDGEVLVFSKDDIIDLRTRKE